MSPRTMIMAIDALLASGCDLCAVIDALDLVESVEIIETSDTIPCPPNFEVQS